MVDLFLMSAKVVKNASYFSRFQTKYKRRRDGKTDYVQRSSLIQQDKTKYGAHKYRLVSRVTNTKVIAQIVVAHIDHDETIAQAVSTELSAYGIPVGFSNYASAYCTGLLCARRLLTKLKLNDVTFAKDGEDEEGRRPFKVIMDIGLARTTTGSRIFAVMKGAVDGGLFIPHNNKRLPGSAEKKEQDQQKKLNHFLLGGHVSAFMTKLKKDNEAAYNRQFSRYIKAGITAEKISAMYTDAHKKIRANPSLKPAKIEYKKIAKTPKLSSEEKRRLLNERLAAAGLPPRN